MLLLFTDLVSKCRSPLPTTFRGMLTYAICLGENLTTILIVTLYNDIPATGHVITSIQFMSTVAKVTALSSTLVIFAYLRSGEYALISESSTISVTTQDDRGYGTITSSNGIHDNSKGPRTPAADMTHFFKFIWYIGNVTRKKNHADYDQAIKSILPSLPRRFLFRLGGTSAFDQYIRSTNAWIDHKRFGNWNIPILAHIPICGIPCLLGKNGKLCSNENGDTRMLTVV